MARRGTVRDEVGLPRPWAPTVRALLSGDMVAAVLPGNPSWYPLRRARCPSCGRKAWVAGLSGAAGARLDAARDPWRFALSAHQCRRREAAHADP